jgi:hypothetical protein
MSSNSWGSWGDSARCDGNGARCLETGQKKDSMCQVCGWEGYPAKTTQSSKYCAPCLIIAAKDSGCPVHNARGSAAQNAVEPNVVETTAWKQMWNPWSRTQRGNNKVRQPPCTSSRLRWSTERGSTPTSVECGRRTSIRKGSSSMPRRRTCAGWSRSSGGRRRHRLWPTSLPRQPPRREDRREDRLRLSL